MKKISLFILIFFILFNVKAQTNFKEAKIVLENGDTLNGFIELNKKIYQAKRINFKRFNIADEHKYSVNELKSFAFKNGNSFEIIRKKNKILVFEKLIEGELSLYFCASEKIFYFYTANEGFQALKKKENSIKLNGRVFDSQSYVGILEQLAQEIKNNIYADIPYSKTALSDFVFKYNSSSQYNTKRVNQLSIDPTILSKSIFWKQPRLDVYFYSGATYSLLTYSEGEAKAGFLREAQFNREPDASFGLILDYMLSEKTPGWYLSVGLNYTNKLYYGYASYQSGINEISRNDIYFRSKYLQLPILLKYKLNYKGTFSPFFEGGLCISHNFDFEADRFYEIEYQNIVQMYYQSYSDELHEMSALSLGLGLEYKISDSRKMFLKLNYIYSQGPLMNYMRVKPKLNVYQISVGVSL